jgi:hypothetical protein
MARQTITRLTSRIEGLAERLPERQWTTVSGGSAEECRERLEALRATGKRIGNVRFIIIDCSGENRD